MKECCRWWNAIRNINRPALWADEWTKAAARMTGTHNNRKRTPPKRNTTRNVSSWYLASRRILMKHLDAVRRNRDPWAKAIERLAWQARAGKASKPQRATVTHWLCPKCRMAEREAKRLPRWVMRCLGQHKTEVSRAAKTAWGRKLDAISSGANARASAKQRTRKESTIRDWQAGMMAAINNLNIRSRWRYADEWTKWATNTASNNAKRQRRKSERMQSKQQQSTEAA